jgi:hypothetical protein
MTYIGGNPTCRLPLKASQVPLGIEEATSTPGALMSG